MIRVHLEQIAENFPTSVKRIFKTNVTRIALDPSSSESLGLVREMLYDEKLPITAVEVLEAYRNRGVSIEIPQSFYDGCFSKILNSSETPVITRNRIRLFQIEVIKFRKTGVPNEFSDRLIDSVFFDPENKNHAKIVSLLTDLTESKLISFSDGKIYEIYSQTLNIGLPNEMALIATLARNYPLPDLVLKDLVTMHVQTGEEYSLTLMPSRRANGLPNSYTRMRPRTELKPLDLLSVLMSGVPFTEEERRFGVAVQTFDELIATGKFPNAKARKHEFLNSCDFMVQRLLRKKS